ncbi:AraC family transcriptional regulator [Treponema sp. TIM-1]|uniref:helix-turn-helix transcriptional regulator n=1 Tax=Treponema sp. TIM-1 TaxID=2898417 RepID=UPI00397E9ECE
MFENLTDVTCYRLFDAAHVNNIASGGLLKPKFSETHTRNSGEESCRIFFFIKENSGTVMYNGNWKDIHDYQMFFIFPGEDFTMKCEKEATDCFYISFRLPGKIPWNNFDNVIVLNEFKREFLDLSISLASACLLKERDKSADILGHFLQRLDEIITKSSIVFATRHFDTSFKGFPRHFHAQEYQIDYCASGTGYYFMVDHWVKYSPGTFCFVPPPLVHESILSQTDKADIYGIKFLVANDRHILLPPREPFVVKVPPERRSKILSILKKITGQSVQDLPISSLMLNNLIALLHDLKNSLEYLEDANLLTQVKQAVDTGYSFPLKIADIALQLHLTPEHLSRQFKKLSGQTLASYINNLRINSSITMLVNTDMPLKQIASECGFKNVNYFNTVFKQRYAITPREMRRQNLSTTKRQDAPV